MSGNHNRGSSVGPSLPIAGLSASDRHSMEGQTVDPSQQGIQPGAQVSGSTFSVGSLPESTLVSGKPKHVRKISGKQYDLWGSVFPGTKSDRLEAILRMDPAYTSENIGYFIQSIEYQGFDREFYISHALTKMSVEVFSKFAVLGALRGSNFKKITDTCEHMPEQLTTSFSSCGFVKQPKRRTDLTILRCTASIPHWCSYWFLTNSAPKKIPTSKCHAALQYPGAASLPMSRSVRLEHMQFSEEFSMLLPGGAFNINIYLTAAKNQIPIKDVPAEVLVILGISSGSDSYMITEDDTSKYTKAIVKR